MSDRDGGDVGDDDNGDLAVPDQPDRVEVAQEGCSDLGAAEPEEVPAEAEGVAQGDRGVLSPFNAWLILPGAATLPIRMKAHEESALAVARYLEAHPAVSRVHYPGLASHPQHDLAKRQMRNFSGMLSFQSKQDGAILAQRMIERLEVVHYAVSFGHHRSLVCWIPTEMLMASTFRLAPAAGRKYRSFAGDGVFRFSVGIEDADDICADLERVLG